MTFIRRYHQACLSLLFVVGLMGPLCIVSPSQTADDTRGIRPREYAAKLQNQINKKRRHLTASARSKATQKSYFPKNSDMSPVAEGVDVGITFWRLQPVLKGDDPKVTEKTRIVKRIREKDKEKDVESTAKMIATRVRSDTLFADDEMFRLSIEVPFESYVYILNQEQYSDQTLSEPFLVFPSKADTSQSGRIVPAQLVYIPQEPDYFQITSLNPDGKKKEAEVFTIILTAKPIEELPPLGNDEAPRKIHDPVFQRFLNEWSSKIWKFELEGGRENHRIPITHAEKKAGATGGALLTDGDPQPQTVYHVTQKQQGVVLITVPVQIRKRS